MIDKLSRFQKVYLYVHVNFVITTPYISTVDSRELMKGYWRQNSAQGSLQEMMLDSEADSLSLEEGPEILGSLPDYARKDVVELGAGIG